MRARLKKTDSTKAQVREKAILAVVAWRKGSTQRAEALGRMAALCGLSEKRCYRLVAEWEKSRAAGGDPGATLVRKERCDAGSPRAGGEELRRDAAWLQAAGASELARLQQEQARQAARELQLLWAKYCIDSPHLKTTVLRRLFEEQNPTIPLPSTSRLRIWRHEIDPAYGMTRKELMREFKPRGRVEAAYPNHVWLADQHVADVFVWYTDHETGEMRPKRPTLFTFIDRFTGLPMYAEYGWHYTTEQVALCLWQAMLPDYERNLAWSGLPEHIYWDWGGQHWSSWMRDTCAALRIETHAGEAYEWAPHGFMEGYHSILHAQFEALLPGFAGSDHTEDDLPLPWRRFGAGEGECPVYLDLDDLNRRHHEWRRWLADQPYRDGKYTRQQLYDLNVGERASFPSWETFPLAILKHETRKPDDEGVVTVHNLEYQGWPLNELKGETVWVAYLPGHMGHIWVLSRDRQQIRGVVPLRRPDLFGADPALRAANRRRAAARAGMRSAEQHKQAIAALAARGAVSDEDAARASGVLTRLQAVQKEEVTTLAALAAAADPPPDNVIEFRPQVVAEERSVVDAADTRILDQVLASAATDESRTPAAPRATGVAGGLFD